AGPRCSPRGPRRARAPLAPQDARAPSGHDHRARRRVRHGRHVRLRARAPARSGPCRDRGHRAVRRGGARALPGRRGALPGRLALRARRAARVLRRGVVPAHPRAPAGLRARGAADVRARAQEARDRLLPAAAPATVEAQARRAVRAGLLHAHVRSRPLRRSSPERPHACALGSPDPSAPGDERSGFQVGRPREHRLRGHPVSVSLVIATFNHARFLGAALDSALAQTLRRVEVIVVDDGSTDDTPAVLDRYADRVRVIRQPNRGLPAARNTGLAAARGTYVSFLDADDVAMPTKLAEQVAVLEAAPTVGWTYCDVLIETVATGSEMLVSERFGYRGQPGGMSEGRSRMDRNRFRVLDKLCRARPAAVEGLGAAGRRIIADTHNWLGKEAYARGDWAEARRRFAASLVTVPWQRQAP